MIADVDGDSEVELISMSTGYYKDSVLIKAYNLDGTLVDGFIYSVRTAYTGTVNTPALVDLDSDGDLELITGMEGLYVYDLSGASDPLLNFWMQEGFDYRRSHVISAVQSAKFVSTYKGVCLSGAFNKWGKAMMKLVGANTWELKGVELVPNGHISRPGFLFEGYIYTGGSSVKYSWGDNEGDGIAETDGLDIQVK